MTTRSGCWGRGGLGGASASACGDGDSDSESGDSGNDCCSREDTGLAPSLAVVPICSSSMLLSSSLSFTLLSSTTKPEGRLTRRSGERGVSLVASIGPFCMIKKSNVTMA